MPFVATVAVLFDNTDQLCDESLLSLKEIVNEMGRHRNTIKPLEHCRMNLR